MLDKIIFQKQIPLLRTRARAGFPSPAEDYFLKRLDPRELLEINPETTFYGQVSGTTWEGHKIFDKDILAIDRSITPGHGLIAAVTYEDQFTLKKIVKIKDSLYLLAENEQGEPIPIIPSSEVRLWGIATSVTRKLLKR
ncbi:LexA family protein [Leptospira kmetyi]|uniref:LexA family protein n=1 Tax=Leptospira kmetyi TaxID=408139 RepID=UPI00068420E1|nr:S24 family peptidase [Leptospira kmetyi]